MIALPRISKPRRAPAVSGDGDRMDGQGDSIPLSLEEASDLIACLYDTALDPGCWPVVLDRFRRQLGFEQAVVSLQELPSGRVLLHETAGMAPEWIARIGDYASDILALWGGPGWLAAHPAEEPAVMSWVNPEIASGTSRNRYFLEWHRPQGLIDVLSVKLTPDTTSLTGASLVRHERQGPIGAIDVDRVRIFAPHLRRAMQISRLMDLRRVTDSAAAATLESLATPVLLLDADLTLIHANAAGARMLEEGRPLRLRGRRVEAEPAARRRLAAGVRALSFGGSARAGEIALTGRDGQPVMLHLVALDRQATAIGLGGVLVAVSGQEAARSHSFETMGLALGMTPAQAAVFHLLAEGHSVADAAEHLGIAVSTLRSHLLQIYEKCGLRGQADLVRMAARLQSPFTP